jgi:glycosyltransferase involved in cell wall biosynthesis
MTTHLASDVVVSVICMAYNHERYIAKTLDGFLMQKTTFPVEFIVHDDASDDGTAEIIRNYDRRNPGRFRCVFQSENQYSQLGVALFHDVLVPLSSGEFIAVCEGDDHWTDPNKLEMQVGFMRENPELSMSFHAARVVYADRSRGDRIHAFRGGHVVRPEEVVLHGGGLYPTCSSMFRRDVFEDYPRFFLAAPVADSMWVLNAITKGCIGYIDEVMAVYNCRVPGSWSYQVVRMSLAERLEFISRLEAVRIEFNSYTNGEYSKWIRMRVSRNRRGVLASGACEKGSYGHYRRMAGSMLARDRILFHLEYLYFRFRAFARKTFKQVPRGTS